MKGFEIGQRVVAANSAPCHRCFYCSRGRVNLCEDLLFNNGAYAEYIRIPARIVRVNTYVIPPHLDYRDAALAEPLACVVKGVEDVEMKAGDTVAVIGAGPIGSMFVRLAKLRGARALSPLAALANVSNASHAWALIALSLPKTFRIRSQESGN